MFGLMDQPEFHFTFVNLDALAPRGKDRVSLYAIPENNQLV